MKNMIITSTVTYIGIITGQSPSFMYLKGWKTCLCAHHWTPHPELRGTPHCHTAQAKNEWSYTSTPPFYAFVAWTGELRIFILRSSGISNLKTTRGILWNGFITAQKQYCGVTKHRKAQYSRTSLIRINLLKPTGHVMHQQFNIQQLYVLPTLYLCVLYLSENKQRPVPLTA